MEPAPIPNGIAQRHSHKRLCEHEKPNKATAVKLVLIAVIFSVPSLATNLTLNKLEMTVPPEISIDTMLT